MVDGASSESGFSMVELLVAMVITLIVSGAIYGLLAGGQNAFRREPELTERQQNIRMAMDVIMRDVANAGVGLPPFVQVFRNGLDATAASPVGPNSVRTDELEMISTGGRDSEPVCADPGQSSNVIVLARGNVNIPVPSIVVLTTSDGRWTTHEVTSVQTTSTATGTCAAGGSHTRVNFSSGGTVSGMNGPGGPCNGSALPGYTNFPPGGISGCTISSMSFSEFVRYRVRNDVDGVPVLQRFSSSRWADGFQTIARGIEDLQVQYAQMATPTVWVDGAPPVYQPVPPTAPPTTAYGTLTRHVRVTLSAKSEAQRVQGMQTSATGGTALRGSLTTTGSPRSALFHVARGRPPASPAPSPAVWYWE